MVDKKCSECDIVIHGHTNKKYCDECRYYKRLESMRKFNLKRRKIIKISDIEKINENEMFKVIENYEVYYISNMGRVFSRVYGELHPQLNNGGYKEVRFSKEGGHSWFRVHRLVAKHFIENDNPEYTIIDHINRNRTDNRVDNLRWCNHKINSNNAISVINRKGSVDKTKNSLKPFRVRFYSKDLSNKRQRSRYFATRDEAEEFLEQQNAD